MNPTKIITKTCQCCGETVANDDLASFEAHGLEDDDDPRYQCENCGEIYEDRADAKECCK